LEAFTNRLMQEKTSRDVALADLCIEHGLSEAFNVLRAIKQVNCFLFAAHHGWRRTQKMAMNGELEATGFPYPSATVLQIDTAV
jgi:hypothetical protein